MTNEYNPTDTRPEGDDPERDPERADFQGGRDPADIADEETGVGPISGEEAMDDDSDYRHTPISPNANR